METRTGRGRGGRGLCFDDTFITPSSRQMLSSCQGEQRCWVKRNNSMQILISLAAMQVTAGVILPPFGEGRNSQLSADFYRSS